MKATIPQPVHESYLKHRKQILWQIILPVALTSLLIVALIVLINIATFNQGGDVARWAAISTIWIVIPIMIGMLIFLRVVHPSIAPQNIPRRQGLHLLCQPPVDR